MHGAGAGCRRTQALRQRVALGPGPRGRAQQLGREPGRRALQLHLAGSRLGADGHGVQPRIVGQVQQFQRRQRGHGRRQRGKAAVGQPQLPQPDGLFDLLRQFAQIEIRGQIQRFQMGQREQRSRNFGDEAVAGGDGAQAGALRQRLGQAVEPGIVGKIDRFQMGQPPQPGGSSDSARPLRSSAVERSAWARSMRAAASSRCSMKLPWRFCRPDFRERLPAMRDQNPPRGARWGSAAHHSRMARLHSACPAFGGPARRPVRTVSARSRAGPVRRDTNPAGHPALRALGASGSLRGRDPSARDGPKG